MMLFIELTRLEFNLIWVTGLLYITGLYLFTLTITQFIEVKGFNGIVGKSLVIIFWFLIMIYVYAKRNS